MKHIQKKGRPKKVIKYTKTINVRLTKDQWIEVLNWAQKAHLEPSVYIRKILLDFLNIHYTQPGPHQPANSQNN